MLSPLPRHSDGRYCIAHPSRRISLPRYGCQVGPCIVLFEACSAFTHVTACTLAPSPYLVTRIPKASTISLPPSLLRLLPAGAVAGWGLHPLGKRRLFTAHAKSGHGPRYADHRCADRCSGGLAAADGRNIRTAMQSNDTPKNRRSAMKHPNSQRPCAPAAISMTGRANRARG